MRPKVRNFPDHGRYIDYTLTAQHTELEIIEKYQLHRPSLKIEPDTTKTPEILQDKTQMKFCVGRTRVKKLPAVLAHRPAVEAGEVFAEKHHAHRDSAAHPVLAIFRGRVALQKQLRHAAVSFLVLGDFSVGLLDPFGNLGRLETHLNEVIGDRFAGQGQSGDALAGVVQSFHGVEHGDLS